MTEDTIRTKRLELVDDNVRAVLGSEVNGAPALAMWGQDGGMRARLSLRDNALPSFELLDENGDSRLQMQRTDSGTWGLYFMDSNETVRMQLMMADNPDLVGQYESTSLTLHDKTGKQRDLIVVGPDGQPSIQMRDGEHLQIHFGTTEQGYQQLLFRGTEGDIARLHIAPDGSLELRLIDRDEQTVQVAIRRGEAPLVALTDAEGNILNGLG